jgi:hypothetical protein
MNQMIINFDATGFEGFETANEYFSFCSKTAKDSEGRHLKQHYQAAEMDMSPSQWSQKLNRLNGTGIMLDEAFTYSHKTNDWRWLDYANWARANATKDDVDFLVAERDRLNARILKVAKR